MIVISHTQKSMKETRNAKEVEEQLVPKTAHNANEEDGEWSFFVKVKYDFEPTKEDQLKLR